MNLLEEIGNTQTFITCSDESDLDESENHRVYSVSSVQGVACVTEKRHGLMENSQTDYDPEFI